MIDLKSLSMCVDIARIALASRRASSHLDCIRILRRTPWGARLPVSVLRSALRAVRIERLAERAALQRAASSNN
jgi:hypothetical protein